MRSTERRGGSFRRHLGVSNLYTNKTRRQSNCPCEHKNKLTCTAFAISSFAANMSAAAKTVCVALVPNPL